MFFFAWCGPDEAFATGHLREDEIVFAFDIAHQEGQLPTLSIDVKNPHIGLLAPGRAQWAWLSYQSSLGTFPLFYGRLVALPSNLLGEVVTLQFIARPDDYLAQKQAIANGLMVEPYHDPIWIDPTKLNDPDTVLETYAMMWHVDRVTHEVSISDILFGEDGTEEFQPEDSFYDSVSISFAQSPQTQVVFDGTIQWTQAYTGFIRMPDVTFMNAWNGEQIFNDWPKPGDQLHHGWTVEDAAMVNWSDQSAGNNPLIIDIGGGTIPNFNPPPPPPNSRVTGTSRSPAGIAGVASQVPKQSPTGGPVSASFSWSSDAQTHSDGEVIAYSENVSYDSGGRYGVGSIASSSVSVSYVDGAISSYTLSESYSQKGAPPQTAPSTAPSTPIIIRVDGTIDPTSGGPITIPSLFGQILFRYDLNRDRIETIRFVMNSDIQPIVLLPPDESVNQIKLSMHGSDVGLPLDSGGTIAPIGDPGRSSFFPSDRGLLAMQYPMLVARAHLAQSARAAKISFDCTFEQAIDLSCRKNALLHDARLPGGQVTGKITEYHLRADGDKGELIGNVQIESTIGKGTSIVVNAGAPAFVEENYVVHGYQFYSDADISLPTGDANIVAPPTVLIDDGISLPLTFNQAVMAFQVHEGTPLEVVQAGSAATADPTWLEIVLMPVTGQKFTASYDLGTSTLVLPKLIDLAASSA